MDFSTTVDIAAPPGAVWTVMADIERWHEWTASIKGIRQLTKGPLAVGSRALVRQPRFPPAVWTVTAFEPGRSFVWVTGSPLIRAYGQHSVTPIAGGSRVTLALHYEGWAGPAFARWTTKITERYLGLEAAGLKKRSETGA